MALRINRRFRLPFAALACVAAVGALPTQAGAAPAPISNLVLNAYRAGSGPNSKSVASHSRLASNGLYVATIQGTVSYYAAINYLDIQVPWKAMCGAPASAPMFSAPGGSGPVGNDAEFIFAQPTKLASCTGQHLPAHWTNLQVNVGAGWSHPNALSLGALNAPTASHSYEYPLIGRHKPASFRLVDPDTQDDYGSFHISIRRAVSGDCTGQKYKAFAFGTVQACVAATSASGPAPATRNARPAITLDQGPVTRVLRGTDVPGARNLELPSGALTGAQFLAADGLTGAAAREAQLVLGSDGFVSGAVSSFADFGPTLTSAALKLSSPQKAEAALAAWVNIAAHAQALHHTSATVAPDAIFRQGLAVTYTPSVAASLNGVEVLAAEGDYLYTLRSVQQPNAVSQAATDKLLHTVLARG
jgi:hypothetical protein